MVLPPPPPHDAPRPAEAAWLDTIGVALSLNRAGLLILVDHARPEHLGELVRALLPKYPELEVYTDVRCALTVPHGSTLVLVPTADDAEWLNLNRPVFAQRQLRVILFCETAVTLALAQTAVDFFDWISHRVECPKGPPRYAVAGLRCALAARVPGVVWTGGDLDASFAVARPRRALYRLSAALPYPEMLQRVQESWSDWIAWTDVDSEFRLWRVRWALIEAGRRGRAILVEPKAVSPGWWTAHGRVAGIREARQKLEARGAQRPGRLASLVDLEPEAVDLLESLLPAEESALDVELMGAPDPGARLAQIAKGRGHLSEDRAADVQTPPFVLRGLGLEQRGLKPGEIEPDDLRRKLDEGEEAEALLRSVLKVDEEEVRARHQWYAASLVALVTALRRQGRYSEVEVLLRRGLALQKKVLGSRHREYGVSLRELADVLRNQGRYVEAERLVRRSLTILEGAVGANHPEYAGSLHVLGGVLQGLGKYGEAEEWLRRALAIREQALGTRDPAYASSLQSLAFLIANLGRSSEAESVLREALPGQERALGPRHPDYGDLLYALASMVLSQGRYEEAEKLLRQVVAIEKTVLGTSHPWYGSTLRQLARALSEQQKNEEAEGLLRDALTIHERALGTSHPDYLATLHDLAIMSGRKGKPREEEELLRQVLARTEDALGAGYPRLAPILEHLGGALMAQGRAAEAEPLLERAVTLARATWGDRNPIFAECLARLAAVQSRLNREQAPETARQALQALKVARGAEHPRTRVVIPFLQRIMGSGGGGSSNPRGD